MARNSQAGYPAYQRSGSYDGATAIDFLTAMNQGSQEVVTALSWNVTFPGTTVFMFPLSQFLYVYLATPIPGSQPMGDDGKTVVMFDGIGNQSFAIWASQTATSIIGNRQIITFNGTLGSNITLQAWNGIWLVCGTPNGVTLS